MLLQAEDAEDFSNISEAISESDDEEDAEEEKKDEVKKKLKNNARGVYFPELSSQSQKMGMFRGWIHEFV